MMCAAEANEEFALRNQNKIKMYSVVTPLGLCLQKRPQKLFALRTVRKITHIVRYTCPWRVSYAIIFDILDGGRNLSPAPSTWRIRTKIEWHDSMASRNIHTKFHKNRLSFVTDIVEQRDKHTNTRTHTHTHTMTNKCTFPPLCRLMKLASLASIIHFFCSHFMLYFRRNEITQLSQHFFLL